MPSNYALYDTSTGIVENIIVVKDQSTLPEIPDPESEPLQPDAPDFSQPPAQPTIDLTLDNADAIMTQYRAELEAWAADITKTQADYQALHNVYQAELAAYQQAVRDAWKERFDAPAGFALLAVAPDTIIKLGITTVVDGAFVTPEEAPIVLAPLPGSAE